MFVAGLIPEGMEYSCWAGAMYWACVVTGALASNDRLLVSAMAPAEARTIEPARTPAASMFRRNLSASAAEGNVTRMAWPSVSSPSRRSLSQMESFERSRACPWTSEGSVGAIRTDIAWPVFNRARRRCSAFSSGKASGTGRSPSMVRALPSCDAFIGI
jgi:hypothetical protein